MLIEAEDKPTEKIIHTTRPLMANTGYGTADEEGRMRPEKKNVKMKTRNRGCMRAHPIPTHV
jgi:hypothetical protein